MKEVVIVSAVRTAIGNFGGSLASLSATELGVIAAKEAIKRAGINPEEISETIIGNILSAGLGQNVSRQIAVKAGVPDTKPAMTINKLCGSGLRAVSMAAQFIMLGDADVVLAGGTESMSNAPYLIPQGRNGFRMGHGQVMDSMILDGLTDSFNNYHMGITAENGNLRRFRSGSIWAASDHLPASAANGRRKPAGNGYFQRMRDPTLHAGDDAGS